MARKTEITLAGIGFAVRKEQQQQAGPDGQPLFGQSGLPKMVDVWILDLIEQKSPSEVEIIHVPFDADAKDRLVQQLTGGIVVAPANGVPAI
jgi:hypothetical protein